MKMLKFNTVFTAVLMIAIAFLSSCNLSQKAINSGEYDEAVLRSVKKLRNNKNKTKQVLLLEDAFYKANRRDLDHIKYLKTDGNPDNWEEIMDLYYRINDRQQLVVPLLPLYVKKGGRKASIKLIDTKEALTQAKNKHAEVLYAKAHRLLKSNDKTEALMAYDHLKELKRLYPHYKDTDELLKQALSKGTMYVLFKFKNTSDQLLPKDVESALKRMPVSQFDKQWLRFHSNQEPNLAYDYEIVMNLENIDVTAERVKERDTHHHKEVKDGWEYLRDKKGNYKIDSTGTRIKVDRFIEIHCDALVVEQSKGAYAKGSLDFFDLRTRQLLGSYPVKSSANFINTFATARGDVHALDQRTRNLLTNHFVPFPTNRDLILKATRGLKASVLDAFEDHYQVLN